MTDNLILKLSASVPVTYLVKIRIGDVFWESRNFELCFPSDLRFHFVRIKYNSPTAKELTPNT